MLVSISNYLPENFCRWKKGFLPGNFGNIINQILKEYILEFVTCCNGLYGDALSCVKF